MIAQKIEKIPPQWSEREMIWRSLGNTGLPPAHLTVNDLMFAALTGQGEFLISTTDIAGGASGIPTDGAPGESLVIDASGNSDWRDLTCDTIAQLRAMTVTGLLPGTQVTVAGYYAAGDGGGGVFRWTTSVAEDGNGGTVIPPNLGTGRWLRIFSGEINALWFGADRSGSAFSHSAIQSAVNYMENAGGGVVLLPCGTYRTSVTITIGGFAVVIKGECGGVGAFGAKGTAINYEGTGEAFVIGNTVNDVQYGHGIHDLSIMGTAAGKCGVRIGALLTDINNSVGTIILRNICIKGFTGSSAVHPTSDGEYAEPIVGGCGMFIHRGISCLIDRCDFKDNWIGVIEASHHRATTYTFLGCYFHNCLNIGLRLSDSVSFTFRDCIWENNQSTGVLIKPYLSGAEGSEFCSWPMFITCYWEHNGVSTPNSWNIETSGSVSFLVVRDANMGSSWDDRGGVRIGDGAVGFQLDNVLHARAGAVVVSTHDNAIGFVMGLATSVDNYVQGSYILGANTTFVDYTVGGRLRLGRVTVGGHMLFTPDNTYDIGQGNDNQPRTIHARKAIFNNPDTTQLQLVNSPGNYFTIEVNSAGLVLHKAYGAAAGHLFTQSITCIGDLESAAAGKGLILHAPTTGHRWLFKVDDAGDLATHGIDLGV